MRLPFTGRPVRPVTVYAMGPGDYSDVVETGRAAGVPPRDFDELRAILSVENQVSLAAVAGGAVVGFGAYEIMDGRRMEVVSCVVHPDRRRRGFGSEILRAILGRAGNANCVTVGANVPERFLDGQLFLKSLGFRAIYTRRPARGEPFYRMALDLIGGRT